MRSKGRTWRKRGEELSRRKEGKDMKEEGRTHRGHDGRRTPGKRGDIKTDEG